jgi:hypothetical protein
VHVDVKIIDKVAFVDLHERAQGTDFEFNNHRENTFRKTHVFVVVGSNVTSTVKVERVDQFGVLDPHDRAQESQYAMKSPTDPVVHFKTHDFKVINPLDPTIWLLIRRTDQLKVADPHDAGRETIFQLNWLDDDVTNPSELDTSDTSTTINPPWRLDPFQNIIDVQWGKHLTCGWGGNIHFGSFEFLLYGFENWGKFNGFPMEEGPPYHYTGTPPDSSVEPTAWSFRIISDDDPGSEPHNGFLGGYLQWLAMAQGPRDPTPANQPTPPIDAPFALGRFYLNNTDVLILDSYVLWIFNCPGSVPPP